MTSIIGLTYLGGKSPGATIRVACSTSSDALYHSLRAHLSRFRSWGAVPLRHGHIMRWVMLALFLAALWLAWYGHGILARHGGI